MFPSSTSSSQASMGSSGSDGSGLMRYGSAPGSLLASAVDTVVGTQRHQYYSSEASNGKSNEVNTNFVLQSLRGASSSSSTPGQSLVRHSSLPAGFVNHLPAAADDHGFSITRGVGSYNSKGASTSGHGIARLNSQLSFTRQEALSRISEETENTDDGRENGYRKSNRSYSSAGFPMESWENTNSLLFSSPSNKRSRVDVNGIHAMESQFQFGMPQSALEMATMDKLLHIPQDSVPCKIRAKRGCATHPRSIAERERRTRISGKLKKLQELVPNMDKQTSYADMLDLAVQHIKGLQNQVQKLNKDLDNCSCGCKNTDQKHRGPS